MTEENEVVALFKEAKDKYDKSVGELTVWMQETVESTMKVLFSKHENLEGIRLGCGAPSFNDGDPCVFSLYYVGVKLNNADMTDEEEAEAEDCLSDGYVNVDEMYGLPDRVEKEILKVSKIIYKVAHAIPDVVLESYDEGEITFTRDGEIAFDFYEVGY